MSTEARGIVEKFLLEAEEGTRLLRTTDLLPQFFCELHGFTTALTDVYLYRQQRVPSETDRAVEGAHGGSCPCAVTR